MAAGLSYDLRKCFDTVPINLSLNIFRQRGADSGVLRALTDFYDAHHKYFKIDGFYAKKFKAANGILQGCPLSMLLLVSMVTTWLEAVRNSGPTATPKSFADDLSVVDQHESLEQVKHNLRLLHDTTCHRSADQQRQELCFWSQECAGGCPRPAQLQAHISPGGRKREAICRAKLDSA